MKTTRVNQRTGTTAEWNAASSIVLSKGEIGIETCPNGSINMKIGDGVKTWAQLVYVVIDSFKQYMRKGEVKGEIWELSPSRLEDCGKSFQELFNLLTPTDLYNELHGQYGYENMTAQQIYNYVHS